MRVIVDTNVPVVANGRTAHASPGCIVACVRKVSEVQSQHILVLDDNWQILREYMGNLRSEGQPGVGDAFLRWVLTNRTNPARCECVHLPVRARGTVGDSADTEEFVAFPDDDDLDSFDRSDRKFVALCLSHSERPPVLNAVDTDWWDHRDCLERHGVRVEFLCSDMMTRGRALIGR